MGWAMQGNAVDADTVSDQCLLDQSPAGLNPAHHIFQDVHSYLKHQILTVGP